MNYRCHGYRLAYGDGGFRDDDRCRYFNRHGVDRSLDRRRHRCGRGKPFLGHGLLLRPLHFYLSLASAFGAFRPSCVFRLRRTFSVF